MSEHPFAECGADLTQAELDFANAEIERLQSRVAELEAAKGIKCQPTRLDCDSFMEAERALSAASGATCFVCARQPFPKGLRYHDFAICAPCAPAAPGRAHMNDTTADEDAGLADGLDRAGSYLASIDKFDLRDLSEKECREFSRNFLCGYAESMRQRSADSPPF